MDRELKSFFLGGPALAHEADQVFEGVFVALVLFGSELVGAFVQLGGHILRLFGGAAEGDEEFGELGNGVIHGMIEAEKPEARNKNASDKNFINHRWTQMNTDGKKRFDANFANCHEFSLNQMMNLKGGAEL